MVPKHKHVDPSDKASWLVVAWDRSVQVEKLVNSEMKKYSEWNLDSTAIGVAWLDDKVGKKSFTLMLHFKFSSPFLVVKVV